MRNHFDELTEAAVLILLTEREGDFHVVLTKRSDALRKHAGQISFPGGRRDAEDADLTVTALRETHEEVAIASTSVSIFGALLRMPTVTGYEVTAYVGELSPPYQMVANPDEIDEIIVAPLADFRNDELHRTEDVEWSGHRFPVHFFDIQGHNVWGATAHMMVALMDYLRGDR